MVDSALSALGGQSHVATLDRWIVEGSGRENLSAEVQGIRPNMPTWRPHEERIAAGGQVAAWERRTTRNDSSLRWRRFISAPDWSGVIDWTTGSATRRPSGTSADDRARIRRRFPHLLLLDLLAADRLTWTGDTVLAGRSMHRVTAEWGETAPVTVLLDARSARVTGLEYRLWLPGRGAVPVRWTWFGWSPDQRLGEMPAGHRIAIDRVPFQEVRYRRYQAESLGADSLLSIERPPAPDEARPVVRPAEGIPATGEIAPGVHVLAVGPFRAMAVVFRDFVALVEAPEIHPGLEGIPATGTGAAGMPTRQLRTELARVALGKPLRFVVISHHHSDHLGGLGGIVGPQTTVLTAPGDRTAALRAMAAAPPGMEPLGRGAAVETIADRRDLSDGSRTLSIMNVGDNPHTAENLMAWLPTERIAFQGDLFYFEDGGPFPPSGRARMNRFFATWLARHDLSPRAIYGVHFNGAAGPEAIERARRP